MKAIWRIVTALVAIALIGYFIYFLSKSLDLGMVLAALSSPRQWAGLLAAVVLYAAILPLTAMAWRELLGAQNEDWNAGALFRIFGLSQLAKYIPGNVAQHATRAALCLRAGMGMRAFLLSVAQETLLTVAASVLVGLAALLLSKGGLARLSPTYTMVLVIAGSLLGAAVIVLASTRLTPGALQGRTGWLAGMVARFGGLPGPAVVAKALFAYSVNYVLIGAGLWILGLSIGVSSGIDFGLATAAFALSWTLGFLAPGAPAGLGAREGVMLLLLHGAVPDQQLAVFVLLARLVTMLGDALNFAVASIWPSVSTGKKGAV